VARGDDGRFLGWASRRLARMTNNEAEYRAALLGLEMAARLGVRRVEIVTDSDVVVRQMQGHSRVLSKRLQALHRETVEAARRFQAVTFRHVPRERNRLADALAAEALEGQTVKS
jgi:ribonuclease HI